MTKSELFNIMCKLTVDDEENPEIKTHQVYSVPYLAKKFDEQEFGLRKVMESLREDGLVTVAQTGGQRENGNVWGLRGWVLTDKGRATDTYIVSSKRLEAG